jgi:hypothetical protein
MQYLIGAHGTLDRWRSLAQIVGLSELANAGELLEELFAAGFCARKFVPIIGLHRSHSVTMYRTTQIHRTAFWRAWEVQHG